jgi:hypothetical protein
LEESKTFPQHFYNDSVEIVHILHAQDGAEIGQCDQWTADLQSDSIHFFGYSAPKMIKVTNSVDKFLTLRFKSSNPLLISTDFLKYPFWHLFQTGIKIQL